MSKEWSNVYAMQTQSESANKSLSSPPPESTSSQAASPLSSAPNAPRYGTIIPNRIFVGGIAFDTCDAELKNFFSAFGNVKESKIIADRAGVSKGYGFITFETPEEAYKILKDQANTLVFKEKKLNIGQAIRKQQIKYPKDVDPAMIPSGMVFHSPSGGYSYTFHNGVAYFNPPENQQMTHPHQTQSIAHHHPPAAPQPQYAVPIMLPPPTAHHQHYIPNQHQQYAYQQPQAVTPQYQWRFVHAQAPAAMNGGMALPQIYPTPPQTHGHEMIYQQTHHYPQTQELEVPLMDPTSAEVIQTSNHTTQQIPTQLVQTAPSMPAEPPYTNPYDPVQTQKVATNSITSKYAGKRPIRMPRRNDRAVKTIRTDIPAPPGTANAVPASMAGYPGVIVAAPQRLDEMGYFYNGLPPHITGGAPPQMAAGAATHMAQNMPHMAPKPLMSAAGDN